MSVVNATFRINSSEILVADPTTSSTVTLVIDANSFASLRLPPRGLNQTDLARRMGPVTAGLER